MVSRILTSAATLVATLSIAGAASADCGAGMYCGQTTSPQPISTWSGHSGSSYSLNLPGTFQPSQNYSMMTSQEADSTYGTGSISQTYSDQSYSNTGTYSFSGSTSSVAGLGYNESLQATNCPVNVYGSGEGRVLGCYNVVKPVPRTTYYRVVRPVIYVRYPVPVAVPYTSPCHTVTHYSRYGDYGRYAPRRGCR